MEEPKARRQLGVFDATMLVMGGIVGSGIFMNPSVVAGHVHTPFLILGVWVAGGTLATVVAVLWYTSALWYFDGFQLPHP